VESTQFTQAQPTPAHQESPLQLIAFNDLEDELFGALDTPERTDYEDRITLELLPKSIREYRLRHHLTQDELGQRLGVQKSQISKLERNPSNVTLATLRRVFEALNMSVQLVLKPAPSQA
jgi:DNA-binding XRE family transcriptional regulator